MAAMATTQLGAVIFSRGFRFNPTPLEAATYYLPRLVAGAPLHVAICPAVHHADVYAGEPSDLARQFFPLPRTGHRFFFSSCKKGVRVAGPGTWSLQSTAAVKDGADAKVGEVKKFRYKKRGVSTDWLMDEVSACCLALDGNAVAGAGGDRQFVFCNIYVSPRAPPDSPAHQESASFFLAHPAPAHVVIAPTPTPAPPKRPAPEIVQPPCPKRVRGAVAATSFAPPRPCVPNHGVAPPSAQPPAPAPTPLAAPPRPHVQPMQQMPMPTPSMVRACRRVPVQACMPQGGVAPSSTPLVMVRSPPPAPAPARTAVQPSRSPAPTPTPPRSPPKQQMSPPPVPVGASHIPMQAPALHCRPAQPSVQRTRDPFEAAELGDEDEAEEQRVAAAAEAEESPAALQDDDDDFAKSIEDAMATTEEAAPDPAASKECPAATPLQGVGFDEFIESLQAADFDKLIESIQCGDFDNNEFLMVPQQAIQAAL